MGVCLEFGYPCFLCHILNHIGWEPTVEGGVVDCLEQIMHQPKSCMVQAERCCEINLQVLEGVIMYGCFIDPDQVNGGVMLPLITMACWDTGCV